MKLLLATMFAISCVPAFAQTLSQYTSVAPEDCVTIDSSDLYPEPEIDFYEGECAALAGYRVYVAGGDLRYSLGLSYNGVEIPTVRLGAFHDMGSKKIEWRYERVGGLFDKTVNYSALIYRLNYANPDGSGRFDQSMLVVVRLNEEKSCVIGVVEKQPGMNEKARALADNKNASCVDVNAIY